MAMGCYFNKISDKGCSIDVSSTTSLANAMCNLSKTPASVDDVLPASDDVGHGDNCVLSDLSNVDSDQGGTKMNGEHSEKECDDKLDKFKHTAQFIGASTPTNVSTKRVIVVCGHASLGRGKCPRLTIQCIKSNGHSEGFCLTDDAVLFDLTGIVGCEMSLCKTAKENIEKIENL